MSPSGSISAEQSAPEAPVWKREEPAHQVHELDARFREWQHHLQEVEALFQKHVYGNDQATQLDFRQHRQLLYSMLAAGEALAIEFELLGEKEAGQSVQTIDQKLDALRIVLHEWHGPADDPALPESFRQGLLEARNRIGLEPLEE